MKIVGIVNDYTEALEIEDVVKVFTIEKRIFNLLSLHFQQTILNMQRLLIKKFHILKLMKILYLFLTLEALFKFIIMLI